MARSVSYIAAFLFCTSVVFGDHGPWGTNMRADFFGLDPATSWPFILYDAMDFPWLFRYCEEVPFLYQLNVLQYYQKEKYFYHKLDAVLDTEPQAGGRTHDGIDPRAPEATALIADIRAGNIYREILRDLLSYTLVRITTTHYRHSIEKKEWNSYSTIPQNTFTYFNGFEAVDAALYTERPYNDILEAKHDAEEARNYLGTITDFHAYDLTVDWVAIAWKKEITPTRFIPVPYTAPMAEKHRQFTRQLVDNPKVAAAVQRVMTAIWQNVNAVKGIRLPGVKAPTRPLANAAKNENYRKREVVKTFNAFDERRHRSALERGTTWSVVPGSAVATYDNFEAIATGGILREQMLMINAYGYKECDSFWDAFIAYLNRYAGAVDSVNPFDASKHNWVFYSQWFNAEDMERRKSYFESRYPDFATAAITKKFNVYRRNCKEIRWPKYGDGKKCVEQGQAFQDKKTRKVPEGSRIKIDRLPRNKDIYPPLTLREQAFLLQEAEAHNDFAAERIYTKQNQQKWTIGGLRNPNSDMIIPWWIGYAIFLPNYKLPCFYQLLYWKYPGHQAHDLLAVATVSKSSDLLMDIAYSFGLRGEDLFYFELGVIAYMAVAPSHSITEVLLGFPYKEAGSHIGEEYSLKKDPYQFIEEQMHQHNLARFEDYGDDFGEEKLISAEDEDDVQLFEDEDDEQQMIAMDPHLKRNAMHWSYRFVYVHDYNAIAFVAILSALFVTMICCTCQVYNTFLTGFCVNYGNEMKMKNETEYCVC